MPQPTGRDLEETRVRLLAWLEKRMPEAEALAIDDLRGPKDTGFSSDTLMFTLKGREAGADFVRDWVVRLAPVSDFGVFPEYDVALQFNMMSSLEPTAVPVPPMLWLEEDPDVLGSAFYVMGRVEGKVPSDSPPYHAEGWVHDLAASDRERLWNSGLDAMAEVHKLDVDAPEFAFLSRPAPGQTEIEAQLDYWDRYLDWGMERSHYPLLERGLEWLKKSAPKEEPVGICWGDARISNQIYYDCRAVAVIDWEMVFVGNAEADLAWYITLDRVFTEGIGLERLSGFPDRDASIARWEERVGRSVGHIEYYELFASWRFAAIMSRLFLQMKHQEVVPADSPIDVVNLSTPVLETLMAERGA